MFQPYDHFLDVSVQHAFDMIIQGYNLDPHKPLAFSFRSFLNDKKYKWIRITTHHSAELLLEGRTITSKTGHTRPLQIEDLILYHKV